MAFLATAAYARVAPGIRGLLLANLAPPDQLRAALPAGAALVAWVDIPQARKPSPNGTSEAPVAGQPELRSLLEKLRIQRLEPLAEAL